MSVAVKSYRRYPSAPSGLEPDALICGPGPPFRLLRRFHRMKLRLIAVTVTALVLAAGTAAAQDMAYSGLILIPIFLVMTVVFFR